LRHDSQCASNLASPAQQAVGRDQLSTLFYEFAVNKKSVAVRSFLAMKPYVYAGLVSLRWSDGG
jgi:hypothetical protein